MKRVGVIIVVYGSDAAATGVVRSAAVATAVIDV